MRIHTGAKLLMIGDSITDCERARPVGEGLFGAIGKGYVALVDALLVHAHPERAVRVVNMGRSGDTVRELAARWADDVVALRPDWLSIMIGINDVWRQFDSPRQPEGHVPPEEYERTLDQLVERSAPQLAGGVLLITPYVIERDRAAPMRQRMDQYGAIVAAIARRRGALLVDAQAAFDRLLEHLPAESIAWDRIHPNHLGHMAIAQAVVAALA